MIAREIDKTLRKHEFKLLDLEKIKDLDLLYYENNQINVFLGSQDYSNVGYEEINKLAYHLREVLISSNINVYNSYLIYCINQEGISEEDIILLERSSKYLRKYIVREIADIDRIFFFNNIATNKNGEVSNMPKIDEELKNIINEMIEDEKVLRLDSKKIDSIVKNILEKLEGNNEN